MILHVNLHNIDTDTAQCHQVLGCLVEQLSKKRENKDKAFISSYLYT
jgi:hypothetical protein